MTRVLSLKSTPRRTSSRDLDKLLNRKIGNATVQQTLTELVAKIGENMSVRRTIALAVNPGVVSAYVHNATSPELGKIGVMVALKSTADKVKLAALGKQIAMHVAAAAPLALTPAHLSREVVERERAIQTEIAKQSGKPDGVIEKMMEGRMRKFYEESVLLQQIFVIDGETRIEKVIEKASKEFGAPIEIVGFVRFQVGEGIEKTESDFADEVKQMAGR
jgi:elongation factor Ts